MVEGKSLKCTAGDQQEVTIQARRIWLHPGVDGRGHGWVDSVFGLESEKSADRLNKEWR